MYDKIIGLNLIRFLLCGLLLVQMGCVTTTGGVADVGRIIHANKQIDETVAVSALAAYKATVAALWELNMSIAAAYGDGTSVQMKTKFADNEIAFVEIIPISAASCKVTISVDRFTDESRLRSILAAIVKNLPNESTASDLHPIKDNLKESGNVATGAVQQPAKDEGDRSTVDTQPDQLKPLPKEIVTEKSLL
jgi:hypothetical protein